MSIRDMAIAIEISPNTVQRAFDEMLRQGLITSRRGVGMFVASRGVQSARGRAEELAQAGFAQAAAAAAQAGLTPERIRELFEAAMDGLATRTGATR